MYEQIANFFTVLFDALKNIAHIGNAVSNPLGGFIGTESTQSTEADKTDTVRTETLQKESIVTQNQEMVKRKRSMITIPEHINSRFNDTGSPAWKNQPGGKHLGTDFGAPNGSAVFAPYSMNVIRIGEYTDEGRKGNYIIGTLLDGTQYYSGHLKNVLIKNGQYVKAGTRIASVGYYNHTHIQLRVHGQLYDFELYEKTH